MSSWVDLVSVTVDGGTPTAVGLTATPAVPTGAARSVTAGWPDMRLGAARTWWYGVTFGGCGQQLETHRHEEIQ